jgi:hypothetical protein
MVNFEDDYIFGLSQEDKIKDILESKFGKLVKNSRYCKYDFENEKYCIELKSRKNEYSKYPTTLLTCNKITDTKKKLYFVFNFEDGIYYIKYKEHIFNTFQKKPFSRINEEYDKKDYYYIPIICLKKITI